MKAISVFFLFILAVLISCNKENDKQGPRILIEQGTDTIIQKNDSVELRVFFYAGDATLDSTWVEHDNIIDSLRKATGTLDTLNYKQVFDQTGQYFYTFKVKDSDTLVASEEYSVIVEFE